MHSEEAGIEFQGMPFFGVLVEPYHPIPYTAEIVILLAPRAKDPEAPQSPCSFQTFLLTSFNLRMICLFICLLFSEGSCWI